ncbi:hypothetical protein O6P43_018094 [Quillaja saponaria]|uniref:Uncharacterized protein n=1 Tax=Quillaja saponaria TaxID=32244 RepID=A0AAD7PQ11_QUISA|nr:hypothetical protein O6P43_018094 [Quillaja saponaria]
MEKEKEPSLWSGPCSKCEAINLAHNLFVPSNVVKWTIDDLNEGRSVEGGVEKVWVMFLEDMLVWYEIIMRLSFQMVEIDKEVR